MNSKTLIATAIAAVLFAGAAHTVENADGGQPLHPYLDSTCQAEQPYHQN